MTAKRVLRIERVGDGLRVTLADGSTTTYANAAQVPDEIARLLSRMDSAPAAPQGDGQAQGSQGDAEASRAAYMARLEAAHEQGRLRHDPGAGLQGVDAYKARLQAGWQQALSVKGKVGDHKHWGGA